MDADKELLLFVVDVRKNMFEQNDAKMPLVTMALGCIKEVFKSRVIADVGDLLGVVLFGTEKANNPNDFANIYVLLQLDIPDPESILYLETLERTPEWIISQFGSLERYAKVKFQDLLFNCRSLLNHAVRSKTINVRKRLVLFTDDDEPIENDENQRNLNIRQARDLMESGIHIELLPMKSTTSKPFDYHVFYQDIIGTSSASHELEPVLDPISKFEELQQHIRKKQYRKRVVHNTMLYLNGFRRDDDSQVEAVGLQVYALFHRPVKSKKVFLEARNNEPVRQVSIAYSEESGALLSNPNDIRYSFPFAGVACVFTQSEMEEIRNLCRYGMELMGFEKKDRLKWQHNLKPSYFLYPSDRTIQGSQLLVAVLWKEMLQQNQIAVVRVRFWKSSHPRLAALVPQDEKNSDSKVSVPCGFHLIWLPFAEDIRKEWKKQYPKWKNQPSDQCVHAAMNLISKLSVPSYDPTKYSDPDIQRYYSGLQALALNQSTLPEVEDTINIDDDQMEKVAQRELEEWTKQVISDPMSISKQEKSHSSPGRYCIQRNIEKKRAKEYLETLPLDWKALASDNVKDGLETQNMTLLKTFCVAHDLKKSGRKAELIERIRKYLQDT